MDPVTHMIMGAAVAEASLGDEPGLKPLLWGAALGALPDLDLLAARGLDALDRIGIHRGITHTLLFAVLLAPVAAWLAGRFRPPGTAQAPWRWTLMAALALLSHIGLDCATTYGTRVFLPFSDVRIAWSLVSVVDIFITGALAAGLLLAWHFRNDIVRRRVLAGLGIVFAGLYLAIASFGESRARERFITALEGDRRPVRVSITPTIGTCLLWNGVAAYDDHFRVGMVSLLDSGPAAPVTVPRGRELAARWAGTRGLAYLTAFTNGFYSLEERGDSLVLTDLRYGIITLTDEPPEAVIAYEIRGRGPQAVVTRAQNRERPIADMIRHVVRRTAGASRSEIDDRSVPGGG